MLPSLVVEVEGFPFWAERYFPGVFNHIKDIEWVHVQWIRHRVLNPYWPLLIVRCIVGPEVNIRRHQVEEGVGSQLQLHQEGAVKVRGGPHPQIKDPMRLIPPQSMSVNGDLVYGNIIIEGWLVASQNHELDGVNLLEGVACWDNVAVRSVCIGIDAFLVDQIHPLVRLVKCQKQELIVTIQEGPGEHLRDHNIIQEGVLEV